MELCVVPPTYAGPLSQRLARWQKNTGGTLLVYAPDTIEHLQATLQAEMAAAPFTDLFLVGPQATVIYAEAVDGHDAWDVPHDPQIMPNVNVGRVDFSALDGVDEIASTGDYFDRLNDWLENGPAYPLMWRYVNFFGPTYAGIDPAVEQQLAGVPAQFIDRYAGQGDNVPTMGPGPSLAADPCWFHWDFSGGAGPDAMYYVGKEPDFVVARFKAHFCALFGSRMLNSQMPNSLERATLLHCLACIADYYGAFPWPRFYTGVSIGQVARDAGYQWTTVFGSPTVRLTDEEVSMIASLPQIADLQSQVAALSGLPARVATLESTIASLQSGQSTPSVPVSAAAPGKPVVLSAIYETITGPYRFVDVTATVQGLVNSGAVWNVHPGLTDFAVGQVKQLRVSYKMPSGAEKDGVIFSQFAPGVLA